MKIQDLAIIFVIIILPISLLLSEYTQFQIQTLKTQTAYDAKLTAATYDAIKAFQLNTTNSTESGMANPKMRDLTASVNSFRNSLMAGFKLNGYTEDELNNYIPALVYTLYDGFYIYSPYNNENHRYKKEPINPDSEGITLIQPTPTDVPTDGNGANLYGLKPYINYSCRYLNAAEGIDAVITYSLDNYITVQGMVRDGVTGLSVYVNRSGYLIDNITISGDDVTYNGITIQKEHLKENVAGKTYSYIKINGIKYYWMNDLEKIASIMNGSIQDQVTKAANETEYNKWVDMITNNDRAQQYYKEAAEFTEWFKSTTLDKLTYADAIDEIVDQTTGTISLGQVWNDTSLIFDFNPTITNYTKNIENELSNFNQHRLAVIKHKIKTNLAVAISNYNEYSGVTNVFQMPELKEDEWDSITHNISLISFLQGLPIGGKIYNGYTLVTNSESKEVVLEEYIYILGEDSSGKKQYHKIGDNGFTDGSITVSSGNYEGSGDGSGKVVSAGRLNMDFKRTNLTTNAISTYYYYPLKAYNASYDSVVMQNNVTTYDDIYIYMNTQSNVDLRNAFYTALGRERAGKYNSKISMTTSQLTPVAPTPPPVGPTPPAILDTYTITYNANGGTGAPASQTKTQDVPLILRSEIPTRVGYTFAGWATWATATVAEYSAGGTYNTNASATLYAVWGARPPSDLFDEDGTEVDSLHIGDFINYNAGTWTAAEINAIQTGNVSSLANANGSTNEPNIPYQFGGFTVGSSRNGNATPTQSEFYAEYLTDTTTGTYINGWRVFDVIGDQITLISAGNPEDYYYSGNDAFGSEYVLSGVINSSWTSYTPGTYQKRDWSPYVNTAQKALSARALRKTDLDNWYSKYIISSADTYDWEIYRKIYLGPYIKYQNLIDNNAYFWLGEALWDRGLYGTWPNSRILGDAESDAAFGIRVLITLSTDVALEKVGTRTITGGNMVTYGGPQTYNIWNIK